jgi:putative glutamine amidotransferase
LRRPRIGVTRWENVTGERIADYYRRIREAGAVEAGLGPDVASRDPEEVMRELDGLIVTGGVDIDPALYGAERHPKTNRSLRERDDFEAGLMRAAIRLDLPVLGICRGHQLLNAVCGGQLLQHIENGSHRADYKADPGGVSREHTVALSGRLAAIYGQDEVLVNSRHHQAVTPDVLGAGLRVLGVAPDGIVEALEREGSRWVLSVQWHPERPEKQIPGFVEGSRRLFAALVEAARSG